VIETKHATLSTMAVTIQALHVSGKQMTLAVFRQLPRRTEEHESELWGVVRYEVKDEGGLWLVLSTAGLLFRRRLNPNVETYGYRRDHARLLREVEMLKAAIRNWGPEYRVASLAEAEEKLRALEEDHDWEQKRGAHDARLLAELPQLFIAV